MVHKMVCMEQHPIHLPPSLPNLLDLLAGGPATVATLIRSVAEPCWRWSDGADRWSILQVLAHLTQVEESDRGWTPRLRHLLDGVDAALPRVESHQHLPRYASVPMPDLLLRFAAARRTNLDQLASWHLDEDSLRRAGRHPDRGPITVGNLLATWAMHDLDHLAQICRIIGHHHASVVGPLAEYLRVCRPME